MPVLPDRPEYVRFDEFGGFLDVAAVDAKLSAERDATDLFVFAHGWNNDFASVSAGYGATLAQLNATAVAGLVSTSPFKPLVFGVIWPSKAWDDPALESFVDDRSALAVLVPEVLSPLRTSARQYRQDVARLQRILTLPAPTTADKQQFVEILRAYSDPPTSDLVDPEDIGVFQTSGFEGVGDWVGDVFRAFTFWQMKKRSGIVGRDGVYWLVKAAMSRLPNARIHLIGHSFGVKVVLSAIASVDRPLPRPAETLVLLQGAVSHEALADTVSGANVPGRFAQARNPARVRGVVAATFTSNDRPLNRYYPLGARLAGHVGELESLEAARVSKYSALGGIGMHSGGAPIGQYAKLNDAGRPYTFGQERLWNLDGTPGNRIPDHSGVRTPAVAWLIWSASGLAAPQRGA
jgi:hypothetical protein